MQGESFCSTAARITCTIINQKSAVASPPFLPPGERQEIASESEQMSKHENKIKIAYMYDLKLK